MKKNQMYLVGGLLVLAVAFLGLNFFMNGSDDPVITKVIKDGDSKPIVADNTNEKPEPMEVEETTDTDETVDVEGVVNNIVAKAVGINKYVISGNVDADIDSIEISWNGNDAYKLGKYVKGSGSFEYNASDSFGNLIEGINKYVVKAYKDGQLVDEFTYEINVDLLEKSDYCTSAGCLKNDGTITVEQNGDDYKLVQKQGDHHLEFDSSTGELTVDRFKYGTDSADIIEMIK